MARTVPEQASVVVIGGGVIGTSIAYHLAASGVTDVVLVEREELASGSTCKAAGGVRASFSHPANIAIGLRGLEVYAQFNELYGQDIDFSRDGYLYLLSDQASLDNFTEQVEVHNRHGIPSAIVEPDEAKRISPLIRTDDMVGACWSPRDGKATPEAVVMGYAAAARRHGARIIRHCEVLDITRRGSALTGVVTSLGTIATNTVVCAAGAWSRQIGDMLDITIPITPVRRQIAFTEPLADLPASSPSLTIDFPSNFYFHPEGNGLLLGWSDPGEQSGFNLKFELEDWLMGVGEIAERCAPAVLDYGIRTGWAGLYEITPDCNQIIDRPSEIDGLLIAAGYSGHGFLMGPATGEIIRDLYHNKTPDYDISGFTLDRFANATTVSAETNIV
ncbi:MULTISPECIES: FAD-binding oxidoreductase [unclassified Mycolicibacterium]|uniref:NAD(P)/FAD-dependent oxidoreductase n=1 Tax=unclassified Mycolicibacterium TaxID=2636767 RepID=UPI0012DFBA6B|nr:MULTISPECIES: FAD-binding oxidoreductase [unclassified Mycolicibacterium]MUL81859.1 FAD-binding oxidoreductase [Mycolicibacterium sp. CBMA 329]MUL87625.1 FAD-binding oxidoreductase [Mycolicibacterium sp. CBMA 331]MUL99511.1 FAD-binding oxidoreductase [Mycolicibacterium sp. CBMA 334]MUM26403.1 FAD-binding oxidoreductase [Mycolicibacterium sp. CBMA 295]MUM37922.1 FAD-binding oxidoreductase [Mycolicibacterium sp. CBMA 247]